MKLCKDCKHCIPAKFLWIKVWGNSISFPLRCKMGRVKHIDPVCGYEWWSEPDWCTFARIGEGSCGAEGKLWEAK